MTNSPAPLSAYDFVATLRQQASDAECLIWQDTAETQIDIVNRIDKNLDVLINSGVKTGDIVILVGDYSPQSVSMLLAMVEMKLIIAPATLESRDQAMALQDVILPDWVITTHSENPVLVHQINSVPVPDFYMQLRRAHKPGLVLLTSGSTGTPKVVVHDLSKLLLKFEKTRTAVRTINFLMFDHWGGLNTLFHCLSSKSVVVFPSNRQPDYICSLIEQHTIQLLPSTPTFLNMLLFSRAYERFDLSSLSLITYGAEPMPESTLKALRQQFPTVELRQTYGLIELGVLQAKSKSSDSLWVKVGGAGYDVRIVDHMLQIKADSAMLGYLNAPSPYTNDGYFMTGDRVEQSGDFIRILGRESDLINVGGQKVFPAEVETVLLEHEIVKDAVVFSEKNLIMGNIVCAMVRVGTLGEMTKTKKDLLHFCRNRLENFKVPVKIQLTTEALHRDRFKRMRTLTAHSKK